MTSFSFLLFQFLFMFLFTLGHCKEPAGIFGILWLQLVF
jgi:hypothetical protein